MKKLFNVFFVALLSVATMVSCKNEAKTVENETKEAVDAAKESAKKVAKDVNNGVAKTVNTAAPEVPSIPPTTIKFDNEVFDFGKIMEGDVVTHTYKFTNTGKEKLVLSNVKASCGCTTPSWTRDPINPGETGTIEARFDSKNKGGVGGKKTTKTITVTANTVPATTTLRVTGLIDKKAEK